VGWAWSVWSGGVGGVLLGGPGLGDRRPARRSGLGDSPLVGDLTESRDERGCRGEGFRGTPFLACGILIASEAICSPGGCSTFR